MHATEPGAVDAHSGSRAKSMYGIPQSSYRYALKKQTHDPSRPLPTPKRSSKELLKDLDMHGYCLVADVLSNADVDSIKRRLTEQMEIEDELGISAPFENGSRACHNILNKGEEFQKLYLIDIVEELAEYAVGSGFRVGGASALQAIPGSLAQGMHTDQGRYGFLAPITLNMTCMFMIDDFTDENGATRFLPGSYLWNLEEVEKHTSQLYEGIGDNYPDSVAAEGPAGTLLVWDGRMIHGMGKNISQTTRTGIVVTYMRGWMRERINPFLSISDDVMMRLPAELRAQLGYRPWNIHGGYEGPGLAAPLDVVRPTNQVGALRRARV